MTGSTTEGIKTVLHPVSDLAAAKSVYTALLGVEPSSDAAYYVGYEAEGQQIGLVPNGAAQGMTSPVAYWSAGGAEVVQEPTEQPYGIRDCAFRDPAGNLIRINQLR
jgi:catechol 2,3-dioxygenase-like lactoylglutathione lyase family enzyme